MIELTVAIAAIIFGTWGIFGTMRATLWHLNALEEIKICRYFHIIEGSDYARLRGEEIETRLESYSVPKIIIRAALLKGNPFTVM